jgi:hypothetical protein
MKPIAESVVRHFADLNPTPDDRKSVFALLEQIDGDPDIGVPIPFLKQTYKDCFVAFTPDTRWGIVYRRLNPEPDDVEILAINLQGPLS